jgi:hypothetical protein
MSQGATGRFLWIWLVRAAIIAVVAAIAVLPPLSALTKTTDSAQISKFRVAMDLAADGTLVSRETIDVDMPYGKHGIFRIFDLKDPRRRGIDHPVSAVAVTRDGQPEPWVWEKESSRSRTAKIGSASVTLDAGMHRYVIDSRTETALEPGDNGEAVWWWDVIGDGWQMTMDAATVTAKLPATPKSVQCVKGDSDPCTATVRNDVLRVDVGGLRTHTPVTLKVTFPVGALPTPPAGDSWLKAWWAAIFAGLLAAFAGGYLYSATRERPPGFPVLFEPPPGVSPALGAKLLYEDDSKNDLQATLYSLAERGVLRLEGDDKKWRIHVVSDPATGGLSAGDQAVLNKLGLDAVGDEFLISKTESAGQKITEAKSALQGAVSVEANPYLQSTGAGLASKVLGSLALAGVVGAAAAYFFGDVYLPWWLIIFTAVFAFITVGLLLDPAAGGKHTAEGIDLWSRTGGFARFLTTESSESRFDAAEHRDWYQRYLPWAVAFGAADAWAKRYESQGISTPEVPWILWTGSYGGSRSFESMGSALTTSISSAVSTYEASQSSSSGGGFSGGSGGGGGGGGSW